MSRSQNASVFPPAMEASFDFELKFKPLDENVIDLDQLDFSGDEGQLVGGVPTGAECDVLMEEFASGEPVGDEAGGDGVASKFLGKYAIGGEGSGKDIHVGDAG
ncbi:hypothetical protein FRX31_031190 [Thalictrum thalictroides]|uniref:Uncharacterized protein n=1 Tax=Thalictrum thalictroides TaxID=46969 RepID=A0A7J6V2U9_THATH|nr:hypothetical protein FRX31_031190 [Thalictrum thalictroides]